MPKTCPVCGSEAVKDPEGVYIRCTNFSGCPAQLKAALASFVSRKRMDIEGVGPELISQLVDAGLVKSLTDLYRLVDHRDELMDLPGIGQKKYERLIAAVEKSKQQPFERLLSGLNIRRVGETASRALVEQFGTAAGIFEQSEAALAAVEGVGPATAKSLTAFIDRGATLLAEFASLGLSLGEAVKEDDGRAQPLAGKKIVVTGTLQTLTRDGVQSAIRQGGGKAAGSVSRNTSFLVVGSEPGVTKLNKARDLDIPILTEDEFLLMLDID
jgi:DNA ligase (NAD+)